MLTKVNLKTCGVTSYFSKKVVSLTKRNNFNLQKRYCKVQTIIVLWKIGKFASQQYVTLII